jgi:hypothetical protein
MVPNPKENKLIKIIGLVAGILLLADLAFINWKVFSPPLPPAVPLPISEPTLVPTSTVIPKATVTLEAVGSPTGQPTGQPTRQPTSGPTANPQMVKEIYIPLGNGTVKSSDWVAVQGAEVVLDTVNFPKIKSMIWEAFLQIPTGNGRVYAKLYNVSDQHEVWQSEVSVEGGGVQRMESKNIILDSGRKLYRVMMKSSMGYEAVLESARLKIILE